MEKVLFNDTDMNGAVCLDGIFKSKASRNADVSLPQHYSSGSPAGFYFVRASNPENAKKWLIYFEVPIECSGIRSHRRMCRFERVRSLEFVERRVVLRVVALKTGHFERKKWKLFKEREKETTKKMIEILKRRLFWAIRS